MSVLVVKTVLDMVPDERLKYALSLDQKKHKLLIYQVISSIVASRYSAPNSENLCDLIFGRIDRLWNRKDSILYDILPMHATLKPEELLLTPKGLQ